MIYIRLQAFNFIIIFEQHILSYFCIRSNPETKLKLFTELVIILKTYVVKFLLFNLVISKNGSLN